MIHRARVMLHIVTLLNASGSKSTTAVACSSHLASRLTSSEGSALADKIVWPTPPEHHLLVLPTMSRGLFGTRSDSVASLRSGQIKLHPCAMLVSECSRHCPNGGSTPSSASAQRHARHPDLRMETETQHKPLVRYMYPCCVSKVALDIIWNNIALLGGEGAVKHK